MLLRGYASIQSDAILALTAQAATPTTAAAAISVKVSRETDVLLLLTLHIVLCTFGVGLLTAIFMLLTPAIQVSQ